MCRWWSKASRLYLNAQPGGMSPKRLNVSLCSLNVVGGLAIVLPHLRSLAIFVNGQTKDLIISTITFTQVEKLDLGYSFMDARGPDFDSTHAALCLSRS